MKIKRQCVAFYNNMMSPLSVKLFRVLSLKFKRARKSRINERPLEYAFVFKSLTLTQCGYALDVGTGTNPFPLMMQKCGYIVEATDIYARNFYFPIIKADISKCPPKGRQYDVVTCVSTLEHIPDFNSAVMNMAKLCKHRGIIIFTFPFSYENHIDNVNKPPGLCHVFSHDDISRWCKQYNLEIINSEFYRFYSGKHWRDGIKNWPPKKVDEKMADLGLFCFRKKQ